MFLPCVSHQRNNTTSHVSERTTFSLVDLIFISVFCFRFLQFHQTLQGLEVSFGICLRVLHCFHMTFPLCHSSVPLRMSYIVRKSMQGLSFPQPYTDIVSSAKFVMIVEKDATFQRLLDDNFCTKLSPCIMITVGSLFIYSL